MFAPYRKGDRVGLYFEIYNLNYDTNEMTDFQILWRLKRKEGLTQKILGKHESELMTTIDYKGQSRDDKIYLNLDLADRNSGQYELEVYVNDNVVNKRIGRKITFTVID
jgi:hypothetical protein